MKRKFYSWEECMNLREVKVGNAVCCTVTRFCTYCIFTTRGRTIFRAPVSVTLVFNTYTRLTVLMEAGVIKRMPY